MTIKEVEDRTGLPRSNIRFYEKEKLIQPARNESNGYRQYTEKDVADIKKIAYLRTLGISIENIYRMIHRQVSLYEVLNDQMRGLDEQIVDLERARAMCRKMLEAGVVSYENLDVEVFVPELEEYWQANPKVFRFDSVNFLYIWGGTLVWIMITAACLITALLVWPGLPEKNSYSVEQRRSQLGCQPNIYICISSCLYCCAYIIQTLSSEGTAEVYLAVQRFDFRLSDKFFLFCRFIGGDILCVVCTRHCKICDNSASGGFSSFFRASVSRNV